MNSKLSTVEFTYNLTKLNLGGNPTEQQVINAIAKSDKTGKFLKEIQDLPCYDESNAKTKFKIKLLIDLKSGNRYQTSYAVFNFVQALDAKYKT
tara:strand:- start:500 stop:781 length:282 start_codon:yes stop_codon:yes gene_type:complete